MTTIHAEVGDFIFSALSPEQLLAYKPSAEAQERLEELIARDKREGLLPGERSELDRMIESTRLLMMAKAEAMVKLSERPPMTA
jgi:hypothetical protein